MRRGGRGGGGGGSFFAKCGTFYDYVLIALPVPWIFFFLFSGGWYPYTLFYSHTSF